MRRRLLLIGTGIAMALGFGLGTATPASAAAPAPVRVGQDGCGNTQVWVGGQPLFLYVHCAPPAPSS